MAIADHYNPHLELWAQPFIQEYVRDMKASRAQFDLDHDLKKYRKRDEQITLTMEFWMRVFKYPGW